MAELSKTPRTDALTNGIDRLANEHPEIVALCRELELSISDTRSKLEKAEAGRGMCMGWTDPTTGRWRWSHLGGIIVRQREELDDHLRYAELAAEELRNIAFAKRFDREHFSDDTEFADWARSRAQHTLGKLAAKTENEISTVQESINAESQKYVDAGKPPVPAIRPFGRRADDANMRQCPRCKGAGSVFESGPNWASGGTCETCRGHGSLPAGHSQSTVKRRPISWDEACEAIAPHDLGNGDAQCPPQEPKA